MKEHKICSKIQRKNSVAEWSSQSKRPDYVWGHSPSSGLWFIVASPKQHNSETATDLKSAEGVTLRRRKSHATCSRKVQNREMCRILVWSRGIDCFASSSPLVFSRHPKASLTGCRTSANFKGKNNGAHSYGKETQSEKAKPYDPYDSSTSICGNYSWRNSGRGLWSYSPDDARFFTSQKCQTRSMEVLHMKLQRKTSHQKADQLISWHCCRFPD